MRETLKCIASALLAPIADKDGRLDNGKIGAVIAFSAIIYKFLQMPDPGVEMVLAVGAIGGLHNAVIYWIKRSNPNGADSTKGGGESDGDLCKK